MAGFINSFEISRLELEGVSLTKKNLSFFRIKANLPTYTHRDPSGVTGIHIVPLVKR